MAKSIVTLERVRELLDYDPHTGVLTWLVRCSRNTRAGNVAGCVTPEGYRIIRINERGYAAHRLAWLLMMGEWPAEIDHRNGKKDDNRWENLREALGTVNQQNKHHWRNKTGFIGVRRVVGGTNSGRRFTATIFVNGKQRSVGCFGSAEEAHAAYLEAKRRYHPGFIG